MTKSNLRHAILSRRDTINDHDFAEKNEKIYYHVTFSEMFRNAKAIMIYINYKSEVQTTEIIDLCFAENKSVVVPVVDFKSKSLVLIEIDSLKDLSKSSYGILEPKIEEKKIRTLRDIELVLAPGVAFDKSGNRMGYGGGYYDKLISSTRFYRKNYQVYALAFDMQITDDIPIDENDQKIDGLITESAIYHF